MYPIQRIRAVLKAEADAIGSVDVTNAYGHAVPILASCTGKVVTMGMGKAGIVARKVAATLCSTGTPAVFLHPGEAAHGDLGVLTPADVILAYSTSGKTVEVLEALTAARRLGVASIIGITSHPESTFRAHCDLVLEMGVIDEPCPLGLTPSASTAVMLAIGDALALAVMEVKGITVDGFGVRHRSGYLGQVANGSVA
jgi:arabinose-5-phosphate isomerase